MQIQGGTLRPLLPLNRFVRCSRQLNRSYLFRIGSAQKWGKKLSAAGSGYSYEQEELYKCTTLVSLSNTWEANCFQTCSHLLYFVDLKEVHCSVSVSHWSGHQKKSDFFSFNFRTWSDKNKTLTKKFSMPTFSTQHFFQIQCYRHICLG